MKDFENLESVPMYKKLWKEYVLAHRHYIANKRKIDDFIKFMETWANLIHFVAKARLDIS